MVAQISAAVSPDAVLQPPVLFYVATALVAIGLFSGFGAGFIVRAARARREQTRAEQMLRETRAELDDTRARYAVQSRHVIPHAQPAQAPMRWSSTELVALVGAIGTLLGTLGTVFATIQSGDSKMKTEQFAELTQRHDSLQRATKELLVYDIEMWQKLPEAPPAAPNASREVAGSHTNTTCNSTRPQLTYAGGRPAVLQCPAGQAKVKFLLPTRVLLVPESRQMGSK